MFRRPVVYTLVLFFAYAAVAEAVIMQLGGAYAFWPGESEERFVLYSREVTPRGQVLYFVHDNYRSVSPDHMKALYLGDQVLLENGDGVLYRPTGAHILCEQGVYEHSFSLVKYVYEGDFSGDLRLVVRLDSTWVSCSDLGPAAESRYSVGAVTAEGGAELKVAPTPDAVSLASIPQGEKIYLTGRWEWFWVEPEDFFNWASYYEAGYGGSFGWICEGTFDEGGYEP